MWDGIESGDGDGERGVMLAHALDAHDEALDVPRGQRREVVAQGGPAKLPRCAREGVEEREEQSWVAVAALAQEADDARGVHDEVFLLAGCS